MNRQKLDESIMEVAKELAREWETQPMSVAYLVDGSMVSFINEKGITHIYLKKWINGVVYGSKVSVPVVYIMDNTTKHFKNMIQYCFYENDGNRVHGAIGE